jgi:adenine phosphoribosyltransferase
MYEKVLSHENLAVLLHRRKRLIPDFPKPGIEFIDLLAMIAEDGNLLREITDHLALRFQDKKLDGLACIDSRGFIFGAPLASRLRLPFIPVRKKGKLPPPIEQVAYSSEYADDSVEVGLHSMQGKRKVILIDDVLATGGTSLATIKLMQKFEVIVEEAIFICEISKLNGRNKLKNIPVYTCMTI